MAEQSLGEYLDHLIRRAYVTTRFTGRLQVSQRATEASIRHYIEDEVTGRPVPLDDSADHFLLTTFHRLREEFLDRPLPVYEEPRPVSGEIPWRSMHEDPSWTICSECGHHTFWHADDMCYDGEFVDDDGLRHYPCNCGDNIGR